MPRAPRVPNVRVAVPLVDGKEQNALCPKSCGSYLEFKPDAIGRLVERCPTCDGVSRRPSVLHPSLQATQQTLVPIVKAGAYVLPPVAPGQLRCQRCAHGVEGNVRICTTCLTVLTAPKPKQQRSEHTCERCANPIPMKTGRPPKICESCLTPVELAQRKAKRAYNDRLRGATA